MNSSLDDIFDKILHSEQEARMQQEYLQTTKNDIAKAEAQLKELEEESVSLQAQILLKMQKLSEREITLKSLKIKENILLEQKQALDEEKHIVNNELSEIEKELSCERGNFCKSSKAFCSEYGFKKVVKHLQENIRKKELKELELKCESFEDDGEDEKLRKSKDEKKMTKIYSPINDLEFQRIRQEFENSDDDCFLSMSFDFDMETEENNKQNSDVWAQIPVLSVPGVTPKDVYKPNKENNKGMKLELENGVLHKPTKKGEEKIIESKERNFSDKSNESKRKFTFKRKL